ncbi:hypothetical protein TB1_037536 [Malus domestica]
MREIADLVRESEGKSEKIGDFAGKSMLRRNGVSRARTGKRRKRSIYSFRERVRCACTIIKYVQYSYVAESSSTSFFFMVLAHWVKTQDEDEGQPQALDEIETRGRAILVFQRI